MDSPLLRTKFVFFDWGGTLGKSGKRKTFLFSENKFSAIKKYTIPVLKHIHSKGIKMAIVSNTKHKQRQMKEALKDLGIDKYFEFIVFSSDEGQCKKPCPSIFETAIKKAKNTVPFLKKSQMLYIGDNYHADIEGASPHMKTLFITNKQPKSIIISKSTPSIHTISQLLSM